MEFVQGIITDGTLQVYFDLNRFLGQTTAMERTKRIFDNKDTLPMTTQHQNSCKSFRSLQIAIGRITRKMHEQQHAIFGTQCRAEADNHQFLNES